MLGIFLKQQFSVSCNVTAASLQKTETSSEHTASLITYLWLFFPVSALRAYNVVMGMVDVQSPFEEMDDSAL